MTITHAVPGATSMAVAVVSPLSYTMTISDTSATTPGFMDRVDCSTRAMLGGSLVSALQWSSPTTGASGSLSGTPQTIGGGILLASVQINFTQALGAAEAVPQGDCYQVPVTITVT